MKIAQIRDRQYFEVTTDDLLPRYLRDPDGGWWHFLAGVWVLTERAVELEAAFVAAQAGRLRGEWP